MNRVAGFMCCDVLNGHYGLFSWTSCCREDQWSRLPHNLPGTIYDNILNCMCMYNIYE